MSYPFVLDRLLSESKEIACTITTRFASSFWLFSRLPIISTDSISSLNFSLFFSSSHAFSMYPTRFLISFTFSSRTIFSTRQSSFARGRRSLHISNTNRSDYSSRTIPLPHRCQLVDRSAVRLRRLHILVSRQRHTQTLHRVHCNASELRLHQQQRLPQGVVIHLHFGHGNADVGRSLSIQE